MPDFVASNGLSVNLMREEHLYLTSPDGYVHRLSGDVLAAVREYVAQEQS